MLQHSFMNFPFFDSKELPDKYSLDDLKISGWYSFKGKVNNIPNNFHPYHVFVISPARNNYVTQMIFGYTYEIEYPSPDDEDPLIEGDELIEDGVIKHNNTIIYTNKRVATDIDSDGTIDTPVNSMIVTTPPHSEPPENSYSKLRIETDNDIFKVHTSEYITQDTPIYINFDNMHVTVGEEIYSLNDNIVTANSINDSALNNDNEIIIKITNRNAVLIRSFLNDIWTTWTFLTNSGSSGDNIDADKIYSYIDNKIKFKNHDGFTLSGVMFEATGVYNMPDNEIYPVDASYIEYDNILLFPINGDPNKLYIAKNENSLYRYDSKDEKYYCVGRDYFEIGIINSNNGISV